MAYFYAHRIIFRQLYIALLSRLCDTAAAAAAAAAAYAAAQVQMAADCDILPAYAHAMAYMMMTN